MSAAGKKGAIHANRGRLARSGWQRQLALAFVVSVCLPAASFAWGPQGHQLVGAIADDLLNDNARTQVHDILGYDLATAAKWPDCVRSVVRGKDGTFHYVVNPHYQAPCTAFMTPDTEVTRMEDYARRNWSNCSEDAPMPEEPAADEKAADDPADDKEKKADDSDTPPAKPKPREPPCASSFHYADIAIQRDGYGATVGAGDHDVVHAIEAAIHVLQGHDTPAPFSIADKKEALLLLAHFVGDLHQPLHVGAIYLDPAGIPIDPDMVAQDVAQAAATRGGNWIAMGPGSRQNLHAVWDTIPAGWDVGKLSEKKRQAWDDGAQAVLATPGSPGDWPVIWASESVLVARNAFEGLRFEADPKTKHWIAIADDKKQYGKDRRDTQHLQVVRAAARLAAILNAIWPE